MDLLELPAGTLEEGEDPSVCAAREIREEIGIVANDLKHFYTTDFFQQSAFHTTPMQVVSVYYLFTVAEPKAIPVVSEPFNGMRGDQVGELFRWLPLKGAKPEDLSLPIDRVVLGMIMQ